LRLKTFVKDFCETLLTSFIRDHPDMLTETVATRLETLGLKVFRCPRCHRPVRLGAIYCGRCFSKLRWGLGD